MRILDKICICVTCLLASGGLSPLSAQIENKELKVTDTLVLKIQSTVSSVCPGDSVVLSISPKCILGDILCEDGSVIHPSEYAESGKVAKGIVFWVDESGTAGWAVHLKEVKGLCWSSEWVDVPDLPNVENQYLPDVENPGHYSDTAGYQNTLTIRAFGDSISFPAAYNVDFAAGWYLPASGQIWNLQYRWQEVNSSLAIVGGMLLYQEWTYLWSSTEESFSAAYFGDNDWRVSPLGKIRKDVNVRAVCSFHV